MAYYFLFPEIDATIYSHPDRVDMNSGGDEILELVEEKATTGNVYYPSRILIQFKNTDIKDLTYAKIAEKMKDVVAREVEKIMGVTS